jgi:hypothetical protein
MIVGKKQAKNKEFSSSRIMVQLDVIVFGS